MMFLGSLIFVEESGFECMVRAHLKPYVHYVPFWRHFPQELRNAAAWARAHPVESERIAAAGKAWADKYLTHEALDCRWLTLLREYNKLLR
jgi:hypothetical protein